VAGGEKLLGHRDRFVVGDLMVRQQHAQKIAARIDAALAHKAAQIVHELPRRAIACRDHIRRANDPARQHHAFDVLPHPEAIRAGHPEHRAMRSHRRSA
jgi:hypothetical protein